MPPYTDDLRIRSFTELSTPAEVLRELPCSEEMSSTVANARRALHAILHGEDDRLAVVIGPCSIHDPKAAMDYAQRLRPLRDDARRRARDRDARLFREAAHDRRLERIDQRSGPRRHVRHQQGLRLARGVLCDINALGLPAGVEYLDVISPQYISDLVAWGAIGARTTESQVHRELASGLSCPIGFKNGTDGNVKIAVDAVGAAAHPHHFLAVTKDGRATVAATAGNPDCHVILRGGKKPNYEAADVAAACESLAKAKLAPRLMIDASHANSSKQHDRQTVVVDDIATSDRARRAAHRRRDDREPSRGRPPGPRAGPRAHLRPEHYRRVSRLGGVARRARAPRELRCAPGARARPRAAGAKAAPASLYCRACSAGPRHRHRARARRLRRNAGRAGASAARDPPVAAVRASHPLIAFVLGAGAARGFAHAGALKVLDDAGIRADMVIGTSAGSLVGALYAGGIRGQALIDMALAVQRKQLIDFVLPHRGFIDGERLQSYVNQSLHSRLIEQLEMPFVAVATDLKTGALVAFNSGDAGMAVRASCSVPGIFQPTSIEGREYVDGSLVSPVPVRLARSLGADIVIAINVGLRAEQSDVDNERGIVTQAFVVMAASIAREETKAADVVLQPDLTGVRLADLSARGRAIAAGEQAARDALPEIERLIELKSAPKVERALAAGDALR